MPHMMPLFAVHCARYAPPRRSHGPKPRPYISKPAPPRARAGTPTPVLTPQGWRLGTPPPFETRAVDVLTRPPRRVDTGGRGRGRGPAFSRRFDTPHGGDVLWHGLAYQCGGRGRGGRQQEGTSRQHRARAKYRHRGPGAGAGQGSGRGAGFFCFWRFLRASLEHFTLLMKRADPEAP